MSEKLKKLGEIVYPKGKIYDKIQLYLEEWIKAYGKRNLSGDDCVIKFIKYFGELENSPEN